MKGREAIKINLNYCVNLCYLLMGIELSMLSIILRQRAARHRLGFRLPLLMSARWQH